MELSENKLISLNKETYTGYELRNLDKSFFKKKYLVTTKIDLNM